jgi:prenyltransferase beta subunit
MNEEEKIQKGKLINWLAMRQSQIGINGRTGKIPDSCYCFWVTATIKILGNYDFVDEKAAIEFLMSCQNSEIVHNLLK